MPQVLTFVYFATILKFLKCAKQQVLAPIYLKFVCLAKHAVEIMLLKFAEIDMVVEIGVLKPYALTALLKDNKI